MAAGGKGSQVLVWILMGMLIVGLGGFGVTNFGGTVRSIGSVDGQDISTDDYYRALSAELRQLQQQTGRPLTLADATSFGIDTGVRQQLVTTAVMDAETSRLGISISDERLAREIQAMPVFRGMAGGFDPAAYRTTLQQNGMTDAGFEASVREEMARGLVQSAIATGFAGSDTAAAAFYDYYAERRSFSLLRLTEADLPEPLAALTEAEVRAFYDANPDKFTRPESRRLTYALLSADDVAKTITVDEAELRKLYDQRIAEFVQPERRLVERLVYPDEAAATEARNRLDAGRVTFEELVAERGLDLTDVDMGDVARADLGAAADTVFELTEPGVVGPLQSNLGPALFRMNAILAAEEVTFDEAREALTSEFALDTARRQLRSKVDPIEDLLAGGATIEDLVKDAGMTTGTIVLEPGMTDGIAAYPKFREQAARITTTDFPELFQLDDGGLAVLRLDEILAPAVRPWDEVKDQAAEIARTTRLADALEALLQKAETEIAAGAPLGAFGITEVTSAMPRGGRLDTAPASLMETVFALQPAEVRRVVQGDFIALVRLDEIVPADHSTDEAQQLKQMMVSQQSQELGNDVYQLFANALLANAKITMNDAAIAAVHAQIR